MDRKMVKKIETGTDEILEQTQGNLIEQEDETSLSSPIGFWRDNRGIGVIEIVLILVVLIALVLVFKEQITSIVTNAFAKITKDANSIMK